MRRRPSPKLRPNYRHGPRSRFDDEFDKTSKRVDMMFKVIPIMIGVMVLFSLSLFVYAIVTGDRELLLALLDD